MYVPLLKHDTILTFCICQQLRFKTYTTGKGIIITEKLDSNLPGFKWEQKWADTSDLFQPSWQIRGHYNNWVLQLPVDFGG